MCGIFGYIGQNSDSTDLVLERLKLLEYRGYDSWGVAVVSSKNSTIALKKKAGKIGSATVEELPKGEIALGHTRWATHGKVSDINSHPHLDCTGEIAVVHNGIFENYESSKKRLISKGHKFISETDSEVIAHLIEENIKTGLSLVESVKEIFKRMEGLNALIVISNSDDEMVAVRNGSPLVIGLGEGENFLASDPSALLSLTKRVYFLKDYEMAVLKKQSVDFFNLHNSKKFKPQIQELKLRKGRVDKGNYRFYMLKEIYEQLEIFRDIKNFKYRRSLINLIKNSRNIYLTGCGSASYASIAGTYLFSKIAKVKAVSVVGSEFGYQLEFLSPEDLVIAISQSGETMDILESVKKAKEKGAKVIALVNVEGSTLYREADLIIMIGAGPERSVASTKALTAMILHLLFLAHKLAGTEFSYKAFDELMASVHKILSAKTVLKIRSIAKKMKSKNHVYVVGRGLSYVASLETAMKIKEISYIHAEGMAAGELKHGPLALVEKGTHCIVFLPNDETFGANLAGAMEMKARGGEIIGISQDAREIFDHFIPVLDAKESTIIPNIIAGQLLAYFLTIERNLDPDMPRNLAKSVTVK
jgi:glutamine---fructose-6-phosphate transaminase (isomerizing)